ncbi:MAG: response regulator [Deltaproteobacteria bacterium]|jgi:two-component system, sensor histidine kinase and response regulator|nr:response regulator [Deltaproteobacteria bacterium]
MTGISQPGSALGSRILVVDDYLDIRILLERTIRRDGHQVLVAADAESAMDMLASNPVDVVLTDVELPDQNGLELTRSIKQAYPDTEVIVVTGHATMEVVARALHLGAFDYISKPFNDLALVRAAVNRALEKLSLRQQIDEQVVELKGQIEERRAVEAQLVQAREKAELAVEAKSLFLASMSHEIRTPMNGVIGMTDLLLRTELSERQRRFIETIRRSGDALLTIIDDILDWSKIEAGKLNLQSIDFDLKRTVDDVTELLSNQARPKGLLLEVDIAPTVPTALNGDPGRLRQILTNLLGNAIKFTDEGSVRIEVSIREESDNDALVYFGVVDSGVGISQENQDKLFQSFVQVDGSYTRQHGGTGLGLAISRQLSELMGGTIGVKSEIGTGSTFWFTTRLQKQIGSGQGLSSAELKLDRHRILIIDGDENTRSLLTELLQSWGISTGSAASGKEGLQTLERAHQEGAPFDTVLLDLQLPGIDGLEIARRVKSSENLQGTNLITLTSVTQRGHGNQVYEAGIVGYLPKPVRAFELHEALYELDSLRAQHGNDFPLITRHSIAENKVAQKSIERILIAEDNIVNQEVTREMVEELGYESVVVENGQEALEQELTGLYCAILMDCHMPEMNGFEATQAIRERAGSHNRIPIIALTAAAMAEDKQKAMEAGMDDYLSKPVRPDTLKTMLHKWTSAPGSDDKASFEPALLDSSKKRGKIQLEIFIAQLEIFIEIIGAAYEAGNAKGLSSEGKALERSGAEIGSPKIINLARDLQLVAASTKLDVVQSVIDDLKETCGELTEHCQTVSAH